MVYKFDRQSLTYKNVTKDIVLWFIGTIVLIIAITSIFMLKRINDIRYISAETKSIIIKESTKENEFSPQKLRAYILELNIKFPNKKWKIYIITYAPFILLIPFILQFFISYQLVSDKEVNLTKPILLPLILYFIESLAVELSLL